MSAPSTRTDTIEIGAAGEIKGIPKETLVEAMGKDVLHDNLTNKMGPYGYNCNWSSSKY